MNEKRMNEKSMNEKIMDEKLMGEKRMNGERVFQISGRWMVKMDGENPALLKITDGSTSWYRATMEEFLDRLENSTAGSAIH